MRLIHTADWHLNSRFRSWPRLSGQLQRQQWQYADDLLRYCHDSRTDLLLIAGDIFDNNLPDDQDLANLAELFARSKPLRIFISTGNHDPAHPYSFWYRIQWPSNVHLFSSELSYVDIPGTAVRIYGLSLESPLTDRPMLPPELRLPADRINFLLVHGELVSGGQKSIYHPVMIEWLKETGFDYAALGHRHNPQLFWLNQTEQTCAAAYSGCLSSRGFDEQKPGNLFLIETDFAQNLSLADPDSLKCKLKISSIQLPVRQFMSVSVDVSDCTDNDEIEKAIMLAVDSLKYAAEDDNISRSLINPRNDYHDDFCRVVLTGSYSGGRPNLAIISGRLSNRFAEFELIDKSEDELNLEQIRQESGLNGTLARQLDRLDYEPKRQMAIMRLALTALERELTDEDF